MLPVLRISMFLWFFYGEVSVIYPKDVGHDSINRKKQGQLVPNGIFIIFSLMLARYGKILKMRNRIAEPKNDG